jgi:hypothetical protein
VDPAICEFSVYNVTKQHDTQYVTMLLNFLVSSFFKLGEVFDK